MKKFILLFLLLAICLSSEVYGQKVNYSRSYPMLKGYAPRGFDSSYPLLPRRDTVIVRGEEIEVGSYLSKQWHTGFEIIGYGKAKKSDIRKGSYKIKLKPKRTITYEFDYADIGGLKPRKGRIVYVAENAEEKKILEEKLNAKLGPKEFTTYRYVAPGHEPVKITNFSSSRAN